MQVFGLTVVSAILLAARRVDGEVQLLSEQSSVVSVDQLEHALMDHIRLKTDNDVVTGL